MGDLLLSFPNATTSVASGYTTPTQPSTFACISSATSAVAPAAGIAAFAPAVTTIASTFGATSKCPPVAASASIATTGRALCWRLHGCRL